MSAKRVEFIIVSQLDNQDGNAINASLIFDGIIKLEQMQQSFKCENQVN